MKNKIIPQIDFESIGIDEVGRGAWSGPIVACAVLLKKEIFKNKSFFEITDSKKISKVMREELSNVIKTNAFFSFGVSSVKEIDEYNILKATEFAMKRAFSFFCKKNKPVKIDGPKFFFLNKHTEFIIKGDEKIVSIAAASILAKVFRDNIMKDLSKFYPDYKWEKNCGYGTKNHRDAIERKGITCHHRKSFKPIKRFL